VAGFYEYGDVLSNSGSTYLMENVALIVTGSNQGCYRLDGLRSFPQATVQYFKQRLLLLMWYLVRKYLPFSISFFSMVRVFVIKQMYMMTHETRKIITVSRKFRNS